CATCSDDSRCTPCRNCTPRSEVSASRPTPAPGPLPGSGHCGYNASNGPPARRGARSDSFCRAKAVPRGSLTTTLPRVRTRQDKETEMTTIPLTRRGAELLKEELQRLK